MSKPGFWQSDWFFGAAVVVVFFVGSLFGPGYELVQSLERKAYDLGVQSATRAPSDRIAVIAIDDQSLANIGRWPWSREVLAKVTDRLSGAKAKVIAFGVLFSEPQVDPGYRYITQLLELASRIAPAAASAEAIAPAGAAQSAGEFAPFLELLREAEQALNTDRRLAEAFAKSGNVVPMMLLEIGEPRGRPDRPLPGYVANNSLPNIKGSQEGLLPTLKADIPIEVIGKSVAAIGHLTTTPDVDGAVRTDPLVLGHYGQVYPALSMMVAAKSLNLGVDDVTVRPGERVSLGKLNITTDGVTRMYTYFYKDRDGRGAFPVDSFFDVYSGKIPVEKYRDKIVLIGPSAPGLGGTFVTPVAPNMPPVLILAHSVSSILQEHFFVAPEWGGIVAFVVFLLVAAYLIALLPRLKAGRAAAVTGALFVVLIAAHFVLMSAQLMWIQLMTSATLLLVGHLALTTKRFLVTERGKEVADADLIVTNRNLGLAEQGRGNLDAAYDHFRRLPKEERTADLLYNLALDFERKRQFNKAEAALLYIAGWAPKFRDVQERAQRSKAMSETVILGGASGHPGGTMILGAGEKPMLGRYQVEKELGKGAMGVVYQGRDPKIGRVVAIKTMALSQEFEADELQDVKERFFREAETAGRLTHPNVVTIYDAGEEHDLAYIAMEFLKGRDLTPYVKPDNLLPLDKVLSIIARVADALAYAHRNNVVHRDVKPANVMWEPESDTVKVTDFGIARITDSSKTKTGMVLGTPSYMSPEQLVGKKIEGRSDLFSLGVALYQLACGNLPFQGDSMAQLMFKIANEPHPDIRTHNPNLPACVAAIANKALAKDPDSRYQDGEQMAKALRLCLQSLSPAGRGTGAPAARAGNA